MEVLDLPPLGTTPHGFHYRWDTPVELLFGKFSRLARRCTLTELAEMRRNRYADLYRRLPDKQGRHVLLCA